MATDGHVKVRFRVPPADWHQYRTESLWAERIGSGGNTFVLLNSPFPMEGVSHGDVVAATLNAEGDMYEFSYVVARGGHSTYLILAQRDQAGFEEWWGRLEALGCSFESVRHGKDVLYSVDVPGATDVQAAYTLLAEGEAAGIWKFQESHVGHDPTQRRQGH